MAAQFCERCGTKLQERLISDKERKACPACDFVYWGDYSIGVGALVMRDDRLLLVRRSEDPGKGLWTNPGGYCEQTEPLEQTVVREVKEETGVTARVRHIVALRDRAHVIHNLYVVFAMDYVDGEPTPDLVEVDQAGFFTRAEMAHMNVAGLTRWLVEVAYDKSQGGLAADRSPHVITEGNSLFRVEKH